MWGDPGGWMWWLANHYEWTLACVKSLVTAQVASTVFTASWLSIKTATRFNLKSKNIQKFLGACPHTPSKSILSVLHTRVLCKLCLKTLSTPHFKFYLNIFNAHNIYKRDPIWKLSNLPRHKQKTLGRLRKIAKVRSPGTKLRKPLINVF